MILYSLWSFIAYDRLKPMIFYSLWSLADFRNGDVYVGYSLSGQAKKKHIETEADIEDLVALLSGEVPL